MFHFHSFLHHSASSQPPESLCFAKIITRKWCLHPLFPCSSRSSCLSWTRMTCAMNSVGSASPSIAHICIFCITSTSLLQTILMWHWWHNCQWTGRQHLWFIQEWNREIWLWNALEREKMHIHRKLDVVCAVHTLYYTLHEWSSWEDDSWSCRSCCLLGLSDLFSSERKSRCL